MSADSLAFHLKGNKNRTGEDRNLWSLARLFAYLVRLMRCLIAAVSGKRHNTEEFVEGEKEETFSILGGPSQGEGKELGAKCPCSVDPPRGRGPGFATESRTSGRSSHWVATELCCIVAHPYFLV